MYALRRSLTAGLAAAALACSTVVVAAEPAHANTPIPPCGALAAAHAYWTQAAWQEWQTNGNTAYFELANYIAGTYSQMMQQKGCREN
jgi:hypothetical protein